MLKPFRTLRFRLTLLYVVIFGLLQGALWIVIDGTRASLLYRRFDQILTERGENILHSITALESPAGDQLDPASLTALLQRLAEHDEFLQLCDRSGVVVAQTANLAGQNLPFNAEARGSEFGVPKVETFDGRLAQRLGLPGQRLRLVTLYDGGTGPPLYLQLATSMAPIDRELANVRDLLLVFGFVSLVVAGITSWYMARRSLAPLLAVAREAREITARRLDTRIPAPASADEVAEMVAVLNEMLDRLEAEFRAQRRFIGDVSHELKTPLAVLLGETQVMERQSNGSCAAYVATVHEETRRMLRLVEALLILNRVQAGSPAPNLNQVSMEEVVLSAIRRCRVAAQQHNVRLLPSFPDAGAVGEPVVTGDSDMLVSALENLIQNAIAASPAGQTVDIQVAVEDSEVTIAVRDHGPGMTPEKLAQALALYHALSPGAKRGGKPGIGLTIAKGVAELHRGTISGANRKGGGYEFVLRLPLATAAPVAQTRS